MKHNIFTKTLVVAMVASQTLQGLSSASYLSWFDVDQHNAPSLLSWIKGMIVTEVKELAYSNDLDQNHEGDVDVYDDTPSSRDYGHNDFLFKKSDNSSTTGDTLNDEDKKAAKEKTRLAPIPFPKVPTRADRPNDVDVYDDTYVRGDDYTNFLRLRPMKKNDTTTSKPTTTTSTPTKSITKDTSTTTQQNNMTLEQTDTTALGQSYSPVVQVRAYTYNRLFKQYEIKALGSAVLLDNNQAITNAHVAIEEGTNNPYYLELCITYNAEESPVCATTAKVVRYNNTTTDLALIEYVPVEGMKTAKIGLNPAIGDAIIVHGYPVNGGDTITVSQGIVSGRQGSDYKIDATINHGNSGGGTFNKSGELVGIPTYAIGDTNAIGYIIGADTVQQFIDKKISSTNVVVAGYDTFHQAAIEQQSIIGSSSVSVSSYSAQANNDTTISYRLEHAGQGISLVALENKTTKTSILMRSHRVIDGTLNAKTLNNLISDISPREESEYTSSDVSINGVSWKKISLSSSKEYKGVLYIHYSDSQVISVLSASKGNSTADVEQIMNTIKLLKPTLDSISTLLPQIKLTANNNLVPIMGYSMMSFSPEWGLYSSTQTGSIKFNIVQDLTSEINKDNGDSGLEELFADGEAKIYKNKVGQRILVMKNTSGIINVGLVAASSEIGSDTRVFVSLLFYGEDMYPILGQFIGWLDNLSLGGSDSMDEVTTDQATSTDFFEHKE